MERDFLSMPRTYSLFLISQPNSIHRSTRSATAKISSAIMITTNFVIIFLRIIAIIARSPQPRNQPV
ncbi:hypothetical protein BDN71DRAFT_280367 [Pleurotus eryngii]|uniref:Uncharacterized protein n=1 Tax=Pleurotus eryngii TaxID=5323 RepID=A0A9P5ZMI7_PLEER|nr:hypothetical protein BDN71DRAFT_280367 [Pleurotus eryngii]